MRRTLLRSTALAAAAALAGAAVGQSDRGMMVIDDGNERHAISYAQPDVELIVQPRVDRGDVVTFVEQLDLSDAQRTAVQRLIDAYLEDFRALLAEKHPQPDGAERGPMNGGPGDVEDVQEGGPGGGPDAEARQREISDMESILLEELKADGLVKESLDELPVEPGFGIGIILNSPGPDGAPPEPQVDVSISFGSEDDRLDEALRAKLERAAERAVPRIAEVVRTQAREDMMVRQQADAGPSPAEQIAARWDQLQALRKRIAEFKAEHEALLTKLFDNMKRLLSDEQLQQWPAFERAFRRIKTLPWGQLHGESTDLIELVDDMELPESQRSAIADVLTGYELQLDRLLRRRNNLMETADQEIDIALYTGAYDDALSTAERLARAHTAVRDLNDRTIEAVAAGLEGRTAGQFRRAALRASYPNIYRRTIGQQAFEEVILMDDLDAELQVPVLELAEQHGQLIAEVNDRLRRSVRREQVRELTRPIKRAVSTLQDDETSSFGPTDEQTAIAQAFQERRDLDVQYMKMLYGMLPEALVAKLPAIPKHEVGERVQAEHREAPSVQEY